MYIGNGIGAWPNHMGAGRVKQPSSLWAFAAGPGLCAPCASRGGLPPSASVANRPTGGSLAASASAAPTSPARLPGPVALALVPQTPPALLAPPALPAPPAPGAARLPRARARRGRGQVQVPGRRRREVHRAAPAHQDPRGLMAAVSMAVPHTARITRAASATGPAPPAPPAPAAAVAAAAGWRRRERVHTEVVFIDVGRVELVQPEEGREGHPVEATHRTVVTSAAA